MKITEIIKTRGFIFSCEFFPPKTDEGMQQLFSVIQELKSLDPGYISVTYGAGGGTRDKTLSIVSRAKKELSVEGMAHLTCVGHSRAELERILDAIKAEGVENVIALRGDPPKGETSFKPHPDGFKNAVELVRLIKGKYPFCVAVAGYPEGHIEAPDRETDWKRLKEKVAAGGDLIITQLFFDNKDFFAFEKRAREMGISVPIVPGIMPITNFSQIKRFTQMCGAQIPEAVSRALEPIQEDLEAVQRFGVDWAVKQCEELIARGVPGIHFYTLNKSASTRLIIERLRPKLRR